LADLAKPGLRQACIASIDFKAITPGVPMSSITIRNLDDKLKSRLRLQAAGHGRSMEEEVRQILAVALAPPAAPACSEPGLGSRIRAHFAQLGGMELDPPRRTSPPEPAALS
jgi:plasmid stability protein